ncbi:MAG: LuxR family transcriptional regulator [Mycobacterium sp.]|uniref:helix-turn-helix transcriptional regulator n=1 Tax=Mycobacterium sp. TaxID=1785 RepID=UPI003C50891F
MSEQIVSRATEEQALVDFLDAVPDQSCALVIEGDVGIGKTTLWLDAVARARDRGFRVLTSRAASAESVLAYTGLADLLSDVEGSIWGDLPAPQRQGLDAALLRNDTHDADARAVAAAVVAVIDRLAAQGPILLAIDDLQWLDTSTANAVSFAARRLPNGAALVCTTRPEQAASRVQLPSPDAVRRIRMQPLTVGELHQVLTIRLGMSFARPVLLRIHEIAAGNPFFALELAREVGTKRASELTMPTSLRELVNSRISRVGGGSEAALLAMASLPDPTVQMVAQATDTTPDRLIELLGEAETQAVVEIDGNRIQFTHPVLAHGVYTGAPPRRRRGMHRRLADLVTEPELRARHLALSAATAETHTVEALDTAAEMARARGAPAAAAELLELAIGLGADDLPRRIRCAAYHLDAGDPARARTILEETLERCAPGPLRAQALNLLAMVRLTNDDFVEAARLLDRALADAADDVSLRSTVLVTLSYALFNCDQLDAAVMRSEEAVAAASELGARHVLGQALSMRVMMRFLRGGGVDHDDLQRAVALERQDVEVPLPFRPSTQQVLLLDWTGHLDEARERMWSLGAICIDHGDEAALSFITFNAVLNCIWRGRFDEAGLMSDEAVERAGQLGGDVPVAAALTSRAAVAAYSGDADQTRSDFALALAIFQRCKSYRLREWLITALGFLELSLGNYQVTLNVLEPLLSQLESPLGATEIIHASFVPDAAEALIGVGRLDEAEGLIDALERNGRRLDRPWMLAVGMRCRAMLLAGRGDLTAATTTAELAMTEHQRLPMPFERARTQLLLGQLQRRQRRRDAATATLTEAHQTFERLGTPLWADRVKAELDRGMSGRRRAQGLTPSEQRVAELAVTGITNRDIAAALFISPKTVEVNLSRIYHKLGVRSRLELYRALDSPEAAASLKE